MARLYDVEAVLSEMQKAHDSISLPEDTEICEQVKYHNFEVSIAIVRMMLEEDNRGTSPIDQLAALSGILSDTILMMASGYKGDRQAIVSELLKVFCARLGECAAAALRGSTISAATTFAPQEVGHA